jgi:putative ABC transport system permease protein
MGVLMSLGAGRGNVLGQILLELVIVGTLAFGLSVGTSQFLAQAMGSSLLSSQIASSEKQSEDNFGRPGAMVGGGAEASGKSHSGQMLFGGSAATGTNVKAIDSIDISARPSDYLILFAAGYAIIIAALVVPAVNVMRFEPKTILSGKE